MYNIVPRVNNIILCALKYVKRIHLMLSVLTPHKTTTTTKNTKEHKEILGCDGYI